MNGVALPINIENVWFRFCMKASQFLPKYIIMLGMKTGYENNIIKNVENYTFSMRYASPSARGKLKGCAVGLSAS